MLIILVVICACIAQAEASYDAIRVGEVVVTATRYEEPLDTVPANVTVITEERIKQSTAQNIADLLRSEAGVQVNDIGGNRRRMTVDLRGFGETSALNTLVLVDGRRVNQADLSGTDWTQIALDRVRRIEIIRGGRGSVLYGDNASGGVINIITRRGDVTRAEASVSYGSYDTFRSNASLTGDIGDLTYSLSGSYYDSGGYRDNSDTDAKDAGMNLGYFVSDFMKFGLSAGYHRDDTGLPGALKESDFAAGVSRTETLFPNDFAETEDYYVKAGPEIYFWQESFIKADFAFRERDFLSFASFAGGEFTGDTEIKTVSFTPQMVLKMTPGRMQNTLSMGLDYQESEEDILNDSLFFGSHTVGMFTLAKENRGYYIHDEAEVIEGLLLSGGYRYDRAEFRFHPSIPDRSTMDEDLITAGINYHFHEKSYLYLSYTRSFRYPVLDEMFSFFTNTIDTGLVPQRSKDYEIGLKHYITDDILARVNVFRIDTDDEIFFNPLNYANKNLDGRSRRDGVEVAFEAQPLPWLELDGSYTYVNASIKGGEFNGNDVPNVPRHKSTLSVIISPLQSLTLSFGGIYIGERPFISDYADDFSDQDDYIVINGKIMYRWKNLTAFLDVNNLLNEKYSEYGVLGGFPLEEAFYPSPERNVLFGISAEF